MNIKEANKNNRLVMLVIAFTLLSGFTIDFYAPSFPAIEHYFHIPQFYVRLIIPTYLLSYAFGYLLTGIISDYLGRKKTLITCLCVFFITSLAQAFAPSILILLIFHFFQGLAASAPDVLGRSIIADKFSEKELAKKLNYISLSWSISPIIAPIAGGYLQHFFGWRSLFISQTIYCVILLLLIITLLPETAKKLHPLSGKFKENFKTIVTSRVFIGAAICRSLSFAIVLLFSLTAPFLIQNVLHKSVIQYAHVAFTLGFITFLSVMANRILLNWFPLHRIMTSGVYIMLIAAVILVDMNARMDITLFKMITFITILFIGRGVLISNAIVPVLDQFKEMVGAANAYSGTALILIATLVSFCASFLKANSAEPLAIAYLVLSLIMAAAYFFLLRPVLLRKGE